MAEIESCAHALEVPVYRFFYDTDNAPEAPKIAAKLREPELELTGKERRQLRAFATAIQQLDERQRRLLFAMAVKMARKK